MTAIHSCVPGSSNGSHSEGSALRALTEQPDKVSFSSVWCTKSPVRLLMESPRNGETFSWAEQVPEGSYWLGSNPGPIQHMESQFNNGK